MLTTVIVVLITTPLLLAVLALSISRHKSAGTSNTQRHRAELHGLKVLLGQTIIPFLQLPQTLRSTAHLYGKFVQSWIVLGVTVLPCLAIAFSVSAVWLLARHARGSGRVALPLLSLLDLLFSALLLFCNFATA